MSRRSFSTGLLAAADAGGPPPPPPPPPGGEDVFPEPLFATQYAPWSIPAAGLPTHPNSSALVADMYSVVPGTFNLNSDNFCPAFYSLENANTNANLVVTNPSVSNLIGGVDTVPWNAAQFIPPPDSDAYVVLYNSTTGFCYEFFQTTYNSGSNTITATRATIIRAGVERNDVGNANVLDKNNGFRVARACGLHHAIGPILRSEIDAGLIPHCTTMTYPNPPQFAHEAPAIKGAGTPSPNPQVGFMGIRMVWNFTDTEILNWANTFTPASIRPHLITIGTCIRDYGIMATDRGGLAVNKRGSVQLEHTLSANWDELDMTDANIRFVFDSLLGPNQAKARVIDIPIHVGGSDANQACYPGVVYPAGHPCEGVA
ncbi:hypothetical protein N9980_01935 [bacterium]|nr:hypothetical protein [bacterium]